MIALAVPADVHDSLKAMANADLARWVDRATGDGLCDFYYLFSDPEFRKQAVREQVEAAGEGQTVYEFVYRTPLQERGYHFFFIVSSEEELRGRVAVLEVMVG